MNGLIPETVDRIDYRKGPYHADWGDFSMAGASFMQTIDRLDENYVSVEGGSYDWRRLAAGGTVDLDNGSFTGVAQYKSYNGPWEMEEDLDNKALWTKYLRETSYGTFRATLSGYSATWNPTEQIPESAIGTDVCEDVFCSIDGSAKGRTDRWIATLMLEGEDWESSLYAQYYDWEMTSNPTYDEQINQFDERWTFGGHYGASRPLSDSFDLDYGVDFRHDDVSRVGV